MICEACGKIISEEMFREFRGKCTECIKLSLEKFASEEKDSEKSFQKKKGNLI